MTEYFDITFKSKFAEQNKGEWYDRGSDYKNLTKEEARDKLYQTFENILESRHGVNDDEERFWKVINFDGRFLHIINSREGDVEHIWKIERVKTMTPGFWVHDAPVDDIDIVVNYLNGDDHDQSKVQFVKNNTRYQVTIEEV